MSREENSSQGWVIVIVKSDDLVRADDNSPNDLRTTRSSGPLILLSLLKSNASNASIKASSCDSLMHWINSCLSFSDSLLSSEMGDQSFRIVKVTLSKPKMDVTTGKI